MPKSEKNCYKKVIGKNGDTDIRTDVYKTGGDPVDTKLMSDLKLKF